MPGTRADCLSVEWTIIWRNQLAKGELHQLIEDLMGKENDQDPIGSSSL